MSTNSEQIESKLCAYIDGELDEKDRADIEKHLLAHPHHRHLLKELAETRRLLRLLPREFAPPELAESFQGQLERSVLLNDSEEDTAYASPMRINRLPQYFAAAAVVVLAAGLGIVVYFALPQPHPTVVIKNPDTSPALSPDEQRLVTTLGSKDAKDKDRANDLDPVPNAGVASGAHSDVLQQDATAGKSAKAIDKSEVAEGLGNADDIAANNDKVQALRKSDEQSGDLDFRNAYARSDGRSPMVIVVSAADPQKARQEAAGYLDQLGVMATTLDREAAADDAGAKKSVGAFVANGNGEKEPGDHDAAARVLEQAKRLMARESQSAVALQAEKSKQVGQAPAEATDENRRQLAGRASDLAEQDALKGGGAGNAGGGRGSGSAPGAQPNPGAPAKGTQVIPPDSVVRKGPKDELKSTAEGTPRAPVVTQSPATPVAAPVDTDAVAKREQLAPQERLVGIRQNDQVIVAQNVTREQLLSLRDSIRSDESAHVQIVDGLAGSEIKRNRAIARRAENAIETAGATQAAKNANAQDHSSDGSPLAAKPGSNSVTDASASGAPHTTLNDVQAPQSPAAAPGAAALKPATTLPRGAGLATTRSAASSLPATVRPGERLHVVVSRTEADADEIEEDVIVEKDGSIKLPESKTVQSGGASAAQVEARIAQAYRADEGASLPKVSVKRLPALSPTTGTAIAKKLAPPAPAADTAVPADGAAVPDKFAAHPNEPEAGQRGFGAGSRPAGPSTAAAVATTLPDQLDVVIVFRSTATSTVPATTHAVLAEPASEEPTATPEKTSGEEKSPTENSGAAPK